MAEENIRDVEDLRTRYCPPLDDGLFYAISSEYDLDNPSSRETLLETLDALRVDADLQQDDADFDPSGTGGVTLTKDEERSGKSFSRSSPEEGSVSNGVTSITTGLSEMRFDNTNVGEALESLPFEQKETELKDMFPHIPAWEVTQILKGLKGDIDLALDQLLSLSFLGKDYEDDGVVGSPIPKGVDGFAEDGSRYAKRKGRSKRKDRTNDSSRASSAASFDPGIPEAPANIWLDIAKDVDFICTRTGLSQQSVMSVYHAQGKSLPATIRALVIKESPRFPGLEELDPLLQSQLIDLKVTLPRIADPQLFALLALSRKIPSAASELAEVMSSDKESGTSTESEGLTHYAPLDLGMENKRPTAAASLVPVTWQRAERSSLLDAASNHVGLAQTAFSQASSSARLAKSNRLMGGAAAYYSSVGHEHAKKAKNASAAAANALVAAHATTTSIDLHGVSVPDAIRIARERTEQWYESLGDARYMSGGGGPVRTGYRIVTGVGRHSKDGAPRIGPAVSKMLMREGWKVVVDQGEMMVYGKARR